MTKNFMTERASIERAARKAYGELLSSIVHMPPEYACDARALRQFQREAFETVNRVFERELIDQKGWNRNAPCAAQISALTMTRLIIIEGYWRAMFGHSLKDTLEPLRALVIWRVYPSDDSLAHIGDVMKLYATAKVLRERNARNCDDFFGTYAQAA